MKSPEPGDILLHFQTGGFASPVYRFSRLLLLNRAWKTTRDSAATARLPRQVGCANLSDSGKDRFTLELRTHQARCWLGSFVPIATFTRCSNRPPIRSPRWQARSPWAEC